MIFTANLSPLSSFSQFTELPQRTVSVDISDPAIVNYDGKYYITRSRGLISDTVELFICHIKAPAQKFVNEAIVEPITLDRLNSVVSVQLAGYANTDLPECGTVEYVISGVTVNGSYNPFEFDEVTLTDTTLSLQNVASYPIGPMEVQLDVYSSLESSIPAYATTITF